VLSHEELALLLGGIDLVGSQRRAWFRKVIGETEGEFGAKPLRATPLSQEGMALSTPIAGGSRV
jgi:hypothetical protein